MSSLHLRAPAGSLHKPGPAERWLRQLHPGTIRPPRADSAREPLRPQTKFPKYHDQNEKHQRSRGKCLFRTYWIPNTRCSLGFLVIKTPAALLVLLVSRNISSGSCSQGTKISPFFSPKRNQAEEQSFCIAQSLLPTSISHRGHREGTGGGVPRQRCHWTFIMLSPQKWFSSQAQFAAPLTFAFGAFNFHLTVFTFAQGWMERSLWPWEQALLTQTHFSISLKWKMHSSKKKKKKHS